MTNQQVANAWAKGKDCSPKWSNLASKGRYLVSYNTAIAYHHPAGIVIMTEDSFSPTTASKHLPAARRATFSQIVYLDCFVYGNTEPEMSYDVLVAALDQKLGSLARKWSRARGRKDDYASEADHLREIWDHLANHHQLPPCPYLGNIEEALQAVLVAHRILDAA